MSHHLGLERRRNIAIIGRSMVERIDSGRAGRVYRWKDESFPSVTAIISGGVPKPALLPWGIKSVAEAAVALTLSGELARLCDEDPVAALATLKNSPYNQRDSAADLGSAIHAAAEQHILGLPVALPADSPVRPYLAQFQSFLAVERPEYLAAECTIYHRRYQYAGTLDAIVRVRGQTVILDYKTGREVYPEAALQLAAYRHAEFIGLPDGREQPLPETDGATVLHLRPDSWRLVPVRSDAEVFNYFLYARRIWLWCSQAGKTALEVS